MRRSKFGATAIAGLALACHDGRGSPPASSSLGGDVARVGGVSIKAVLVEAAARATGSTPAQTLERLVDDALAAEGARAEGVDHREAAWPIAVALGRTVPARVDEDAESLGPPTDHELATLDVTHAVVLRERAASEERALFTANAIVRAVSSARTPEAFEAAAAAIPHPGTQVVVERVPPFAVDGALDPAFVAAAFRLHSPSDMSPVIESSFGWHVIYLIEAKPPDAASVEARRRDLASPVIAMRARAGLDELLRERKGREPIEVLAAADSLMAAATTRVP
jgi:hypothetical protein